MPTKLLIGTDTVEKEPKYHFVGLQRNPFPVEPDAPESPKVFADYRFVYNNIMEKLNLVKNRGYNQNLLIFANYGFGKSHIINFLKETINSPEIEGIAFAAPIPITLRFKDLYRVLISCVTKDQLLRKLKPSNITALSGPIGNDVETALKSLFEPQNSELAWNWIRGDPLHSYELEPIHVLNKLDKDETCLSAFLALNQALIQSGVKIIFVGLDELETAGFSTPSEGRSTQTLLELLRRLIDEAPSNLFFMMAATEEWRRVFNQFGPLVTRFPSYSMINITSIETMVAYKLFILEYLESERIDNDEIWSKIASKFAGQRSGISKEDLLKVGFQEFEYAELIKQHKEGLNHLLFPFTNEGIAYLRDNITGGLPRNITKCCSFLIEKAVEQAIDIENVNPVDVQLIKKYESELKPLVK